MADTKRVAVYMRVAHADETALENQKNILRTYAEKKGFNNLAFYEDNGYNGLSFDRPAFNRLNEDISAGLIETVIAHNISRISRNSFDVSAWINTIRNKGVSFKSAVDDADCYYLVKLNTDLYQLYNDYRAKRNYSSLY